MWGKRIMKTSYENDGSKLQKVIPVVPHKAVAEVSRIGNI